MSDHMHDHWQAEHPTDQQWAGIDPESPDPTPTESSPIGIIAAWSVIVLVVMLILALPVLLEDEGDPTDDRMAMVITELTGKYVVGAADVLGSEGRTAMRREVDQILGGGSINQRQRTIILIAELGDAGDAAEQLRELNGLIEREKRGDEPLELTESQRRVQQILNALYPAPEADRPHLDALSADDRDMLRSELGWFGELALTPREIASTAQREAVLRPARRIIFLAFGAMGFFGLLGFGGLIGLIMLLVFAAQRRLVSGLSTRGIAPHGIYAETFAIWLALFLALQIPASGIGSRVPEHYLFITFLAFMCSLAALAWPLVRGVPWHTARADIGLTWGRKPILEPLVGLAGYPMAMPMIAIGVVLMLVLMVIQGMVQGFNGDPLSPDGGPAHPIILEVAQGGMWQAVQLLLVAAVAAPIAEEIMFRGVFYRHLRDATRSTGIVLSIIFSTLVNTFIFAIIHPQGWVAAPALMSLAVMFTMLREWRGTVVPAIITHAVWNGVVMTLLILALRA